MPFQPLTVPVTIGGLIVFPAHQPCHGETVSGDGLFVEIGRQDGSLLFLMVDVMGHGHAAAQTITLLEQQVLRDPRCADLQPASLLTILNELLQVEFTVTGRFVAALVLLAEWQHGTLIGGIASQPEPFVGQPGAVWQPWHLPSGPPLGIIIPATGYQEDAMTLAVGQQLLAFSDGVAEAGARKGIQFQHGSLQWFLANLPSGLPGDQLLVLLVQALQAHVPTGWPEDDTTILCVGRN
jgi:serine phosphatase RsbU (regulator of sigma subunit)